MSHPAEGRLHPDPGGPPRTQESASARTWLEVRTRAVLAAVVVTLVLIAVWKVIRQLTW